MAYKKRPNYEGLTFKEELKTYAQEIKELLNTPVGELVERAKDCLLTPLGVLYEIDENDQSLINSHKEDLENLTNKYTNKILKKKINPHIVAHRLRRDETDLQAKYGPIHKKNILFNVEEKLKNDCGSLGLDLCKRIKSEWQLLAINYR